LPIDAGASSAPARVSDRRWLTFFAIGLGFAGLAYVLIRARRK
jgi:hypothetical protein